MEHSYGRNEFPVEKSCRDLRNLQREYDGVLEYIKAVQADKNQTPKLFQSLEAYQDNCHWVAVSKRYLLGRLRAEKTVIEKRLKVAQAAYNKMEDIAKRSNP